MGPGLISPNDHTRSQLQLRRPHRHGARRPDPKLVCHCLDCKRRTGSAFAWTAHWPADQVETRGEAAQATRTSDEGFWARFHFCPACAVTVWYEIERRPGFISIPAGAFADPDFPAPTIEVYGERRCAWLPAFAPEQE